MSGIKTYTCEICGREFPSKRSLGIHRHWHPRNAWRDEIRLTEDQRQLILGSLLGDMSIRFWDKRSVNPAISVTHCIAQEKYVMWKYSILKNLVGTPPKTGVCVGHGSFRDCIIVRFNTLALQCLTPIYHLATCNGNRRISQDWLDNVTSPLALAAWYLDDGCLAKRNDSRYMRVAGHRVQISLGDADRAEVDVLVKWLSREWGIAVRSYRYVHPKLGGGETISATIAVGKTDDVDAFLDIVRPTALVAGMCYKVTRDYTYTTSR